MNRTKLLTIAVVGLLLLNFGILGVIFFGKDSHPPIHGEHPKNKGEGPKQIIIDRLHFDEAQQADYELLVTEHRKRTEEMHEASKELHDHLFSLLKADTLNQQKRDSLILEIANNQKAIEELNFDHFYGIKKMCKGDQVALFNTLVDDLGRLFAPKGQRK
ncbi:MAG: periplasmic heavy metal sensor [Bacteroidota bacterium]|nr:periplasmic heavy metal sensor [Bacteroidota bacterium]